MFACGMKSKKSNSRERDRQTESEWESRQIKTRPSSHPQERFATNKNNKSSTDFTVAANRQRAIHNVMVYTYALDTVFNFTQTHTHTSIDCLLPSIQFNFHTNLFIICRFISILLRAHNVDGGWRCCMCLCVSVCGNDAFAYASNYSVAKYQNTMSDRNADNDFTSRLYSLKAKPCKRVGLFGNCRSLHTRLDA